MQHQDDTTSTAPHIRPTLHYLPAATSSSPHLIPHSPPEFVHHASALLLCLAIAYAHHLPPRPDKPDSKESDALSYPLELCS